MYALVDLGRKQYKVQVGQVLRVEKIDRPVGESFHVERVLMTSGQSRHLGKPYLGQAQVRVLVADQIRGEKILVFKKKRRKGYKKTQGHRQSYTKVLVQSIEAPDGEKEVAKD